MSKSTIKIARGTTVRVKAKAKLMEDERYFTNSEKLTRYVKHIRKNFAKDLKIDFKIIRLN